MEFFNEKEEVLDLQLTQFGRHLLSKGKFKPAFYSFFDDDILYNVESAPINSTTIPSEEQNSSHERIYKGCDGTASTDYGSPRMKPQISFSSLERDFLNNYNKVVSGQEDPGDPGQQPAAIKNYALPQPMGTMAINKESAPAVQINFLKGEISSSANNLEIKLPAGGNTILKIPQIESEITLEYIETEGDDLYEMEDPSISFGVVSDPEEAVLFLKILEKNAPYQKRNYFYQQSIDFYLYYQLILVYDYLRDFLYNPTNVSYEPHLILFHTTPNFEDELLLFSLCLLYVIFYFYDFTLSSHTITSC